MSLPARPPPPHAASLLPLLKQSSWSPDSQRDEEWIRRKDLRRRLRSRSVTDDDLDELKAGIELGFGFGFESPEMDKRLSDAFPAYGLYYAVDYKRRDHSDGGSKDHSEPDTCSPSGSPPTIFAPGNNPQTVKTRLRQWAQVVACAVRQSPN